MSISTPGGAALALVPPEDVPRDRRGYRRPVVTQPGYKAGERPPNWGLRLPAEVLTPAEAARLLDACPHRGPAGLRNRALIVLLWRGGLRSAEALALELRDVDREVGTVTVRHGKGNQRRVVGLDPGAFSVLERWLDIRRQIGAPYGAPVFCTVTGGNMGRPISASYWRQAITKLGRRAGIEKRVHSHGLRHTHAVELMREGVPLLVIQRQLGHKSAVMTQRYLDHLEPSEVVKTMQARAWPEGPPPAAPTTRAAASQSRAVALREPGVIPALVPLRRGAQGEPFPEPPAAPSSGERGETKRKILDVLRRNGGRATQAQLGRALRLKDPSIARQCRELADAGQLVRLGTLQGYPGRPRVVWGLPAMRAVYRLDDTLAPGTHAQRGQGPGRVLEAVVRLGGRASSSQLAGELGIKPETVAHHARRLEARGALERGGLDKARSNRGSCVWRIPSGARLRSPAPVIRLQIGGPSATGSPTRKLR